MGAEGLHTVPPLVTSLTLTIWLHLGSGMTRVVIGYSLGQEIHGPVYDLARAAKIPLTGPPAPCEHCEAILPYAELWRSMTTPSRAYCEACLQEAVKR